MMALKFLPCEKANAIDKHVLQWMRIMCISVGVNMEHEIYHGVSDDSSMDLPAKTVQNHSG